MKDLMNRWWNAVQGERNPEQCALKDLSNEAGAVGRRAVSDHHFMQCLTRPGEVMLAEKRDMVAAIARRARAKVRAEIKSILYQ